MSNVLDTGPGSLRQAILDANAHPNGGGPDLIAFDIPNTPGARVISVATQLPAVSDPVVIDGTTQPGFDPARPAPVVALDGGGQRFDGLLITAGGSTVRGLAVGGFLVGVHLTNGGGNVVTGDYIGTDLTGTVANANSNRGSNQVGGGVLIESAGNTVGGPSAATRNVISGNDVGVRLYRSGASGNQVLGNVIGLDASGTAALANNIGVQLWGAPGNTIGGSAAGAGNTVSGNTAYGIHLLPYLDEGADNNTLQGNFIGTNPAGDATIGAQTDGIFLSAANCLIVGNLASGNQNGIDIAGGAAVAGVTHDVIIRGNTVGTNAAGTAALPNTINGILVAFAPNVTIGGTVGGQGNLISGNRGRGIFLAQSQTTGAVVQGNLIGVNRAGTAALGNGDNGISLNAVGALIGGTAPNAGNVIAGNGGSGIEIAISAAPGEIGVAQATIQGNFLGTDRAGTAHLGNARDGIRTSASGTTVGGTAPGAGNVIAFNGGSGVAVAAGVGTAILANSIHSNGGLGIDLGGDGVTPNDPADADAGPNALQNLPVITGVTGASGTTVRGSLDSAPNTAYTIQFFRSDAPDATSYGEGQAFLGQTTVTTDASGHAAFAAALAAAVSPTQFVTATATDPSGNTSEFSQEVADLAVAVTAPTAAAAVGQDIPYTITLTNAGPFPAYNPTATVTLPANATFVSASGGATPSNGVLTVHLPTVPVGGTATFVVVLRGTSIGAVTSRVHVASTVTDPAPANNDAMATANVTRSAAADLGVTVAGPTAPQRVGGDVTYVIDVVNHGPSLATAVTVTNTLPSGATFVSATGGVTPAAGGLTFQAGDLAPGARATFRVVVRPTAPGQFLNRARVSSGVPDPVPGNNTGAATATVTSGVATSADIAVTATATPRVAQAGGLLTYTLTARNLGPTADPNVALTATLGGDAAFVSASASRGSVPTTGRTVKAAFGTLAPGASATLTIVVRPASAGTLTLALRGAGALPDPNAANNTTSLTTPVRSTPPPPPPPPIGQGRGPTVAGVRRFGFHAQPTLFVVSFSGPLDPARARDVNNYRLVGPLGAGGGGGRRLAIESATYDPSANRVILVTRDRLNVHWRYRLTVVGSGPAGLTDPSGRPLYGSGGRPGADYVAELGLESLAGPASDAGLASLSPPQGLAQTALRPSAVDALLSSGALAAFQARGLARR